MSPYRDDYRNGGVIIILCVVVPIASAAATILYVNFIHYLFQGLP